MIGSKVISGCSSALSPALKLKAQTFRGHAVAAVPLPPLADIPTITCTTTKGTVSCVDERGDNVVGSRLKELQAILKPITDAPAVVDSKPVVKETKAEPSKPPAPKPAISESKPTPETPKVPVSESKAASSEQKLVAETKPAGNADVKLDSKPAEVLPAVAEAPKPDVKPVVTETAKASPDAKPTEVKAAVMEAAKPVEAKAVDVKPAEKQPPSAPAPAPKPQTVAVSKDSSPENAATVKAESMTRITISSEVTTPPSSSPSTDQPIPNSAPAKPSDSMKVAASSSEDSKKPTTSSTPDVAAPPAPATSGAVSTTDVSFTTSQSGPTAALSRTKSSPVTLATPDLAPRSSRGPEARPLTISRGNEDSTAFSTGVSAPGNSSLAFDAPISRPLTKAQATTGRFPGNVDPADYLPSDIGSVTSVTPPAIGSVAAAKVKTINVLNDRGLVPGNLPPELGDILQLVNAVNKTPVRSLDMRLYPGNVPPDAPATPAMVEFIPGNSSGKGEEVKAVQMKLMPGNVPPELGDVLDLLGGKQTKGA